MYKFANEFSSQNFLQTCFILLTHNEYLPRSKALFYNSSIQIDWFTKLEIVRISVPLNGKYFKIAVHNWNTSCLYSSNFPCHYFPNGETFSLLLVAHLVIRLCRFGYKILVIWKVYAKSKFYPCRGCPIIKWSNHHNRSGILHLGHARWNVWPNVNLTLYIWPAKCDENIYNDIIRWFMQKFEFVQSAAKTCGTDLVPMAQTEVTVKFY